MAVKAPDIDSRSAADIARQVKDLLEVYAPEWKEFDPATGKPKGMSAALINIFARYCELIIQRLNKAPEKNFLAFLDLLGASLQPPQPARVPLTFSLAAGSTNVAVVPAGTQAAAPPAEGEKAPVIFETERELTVTPAQLVSVFTSDPEQDRYADYSSIISSPATPGVPVFVGNRWNEHIFYLGHSKLLGFTHVENLSLIFTLNNALGEAGAVEWEFKKGNEWEKVDTDGQLSEVVDLDALSPVQPGSVNSIENRWLRCRLMTPVTRSTDPLQGMVRETKLPVVKRVEISVHLLREVADNLLPEMSFTNSVLIEPGKDFYPLGEKPRLNDSLYLASTEAFSKDRMFSEDGALSLADAGATVTLDIQIANSHLLPGSASVRPSVDLQLAWECWNGNTWQRVGTSAGPGYGTTEVPAWIGLIELDPVPEFTTSAQITVQGTAQPGAAITVESGTLAATSVAVGENGRFAVAVGISAEAENVIKFTASYKGRQMIAWATVFGGTSDQRKVQITISSAPATPVSGDSLGLQVTVQGAVASSITAITVKSGSLSKTANGKMSEEEWEATFADGIFSVPVIKLAEGRNELLIEGRNSAATPILVATTLMVGRTAAAPAAENGFADGTFCFCQSGIVTLRLPDVVKKIAINGQENYWLRTRLINGDYGKEAAYKLKNPLAPEEGFTMVLATFRPPLVSSIKIGYEQTLQGVPEACLAYNNLEYENVTEVNTGGSGTFNPFKPALEERPTIYYGLTLPVKNMPFPNRTVSLYNRMAEQKYGEPSVPTSSEQPNAAWEYWNGAAWTKLSVDDDSENFTRSGIVVFLPPKDFAKHREFGLDRYWVRAQWKSGEYSYAPRLTRTLLNTTMAVHTVTIRNETLGSSISAENQKFKTTQRPVLTGQQLDVREPEMPSKDEQEAIRKTEGEHAISSVLDSTGRPKEIWVRWHEATDFYGSGPRSRHYVIDHLTGEITFGDGLSGMIPPRGVGNIRMAQYRTGGGSRGNRPAGVVTQLKTTVPYVEKVVNPELASGGANAEIIEALIERAPRAIRHRGRSVTMEDYADLAMLATPETARALCVPLRNLAADPLGGAIQPGEVSVIIVPRSTDAKPLPSMELTGRVQDYLMENSVPTATVSVVGPLYVRVDVALELAPASLEGAGLVEQAVQTRLEEFLHPLTGGPDRKGWNFGRMPHKSDLYAVIEPIPGVDHIITLELSKTEELEGAETTGRFLVFSGTHRISMVFEE